MTANELKNIFYAVFFKLSPSIRKFDHELTLSGQSAERAIRENRSSYIGYYICESKH